MEMFVVLHFISWFSDDKQMIYHLIKVVWNDHYHHPKKNGHFILIEFSRPWNQNQSLKTTINPMGDRDIQDNNNKKKQNKTKNKSKNEKQKVW